jgi:hypothetical protein
MRAVLIDMVVVGWCGEAVWNAGWGWWIEWVVLAISEERSSARTTELVGPEAC